ncbi:VWA domain-containing protein [Nocardia sp. NPDC004415]
MRRRHRFRCTLATILALAAASGCAREGHAVPVQSALPGCDAVVMIVLDASLSMEATDVAPSRLAAATGALGSYTHRLAPQTALGLVTFAGTASTLVTPTTNRDAIDAALRTVRLAERTATGEGIFTALATIATVDKVVAPPGGRRIILVSDGKQTLPADLDDPRGAYTAARQAASDGVTVSTISLGTPTGTVAIPGPDTTHTVPVPTDDESLREIACLGGGTFHTATTTEHLTTALSTPAC